MPTALIILNLDHFKRVNDNYGHPVGDLVLKAMVDVCKKQLRDSDLMGRLGGAEFAIQLPRTSQQDAHFQPGGDGVHPQQRKVKKLSNCVALTIAVFLSA